ncbi:MAG: beta-lactamase family protein [Bacteroidetes bacterium]|nr:beta-lactamase family protein [Bacteroidota bacterium]
MKNIISAFTVSILCLSLISSCAQERNIVGKDMTETMNLVEKSYIKEGPLVGMVIGIVKQGKVETYAFGSKEAGRKELPDNKTIFEIGSITKTFTGTILAIQATHEQLTLEQPISKYLPEDVKVPQYEGKSITFLDLATQSSSLPRMPRNFNSYVKNSKDPYINYPVSALYENLNQTNLDKPIGQTYEYSNLGFGLLGHLEGLVDSSDYETALQTMILDKLEMNATKVRVDEEVNKNLALPHQGEKIVSQWEFTDAFMGAGTIKSNLHDMLIYLKANMYPESTSLEEAIMLAQKPQRPAGGGQIGLGWHIAKSKTSQAPLIWHNGGTGGYQSFMGFNQSEDLGVVILVNTSTRSGQEATTLGFQLLEVLERFN